MKKYVDVICEMKKEGNIIPLCLIWDNGHKYAIDKVTDCRRSASLKGGGVGLRFTCTICGNSRYLFLDEYRWFVEIEE